ncbi:MAG: alpha-galactosidase [Clostridium sp.]|nr:alpha-galactosidase [Clostridium sp.]
MEEIRIDENGMHLVFRITDDNQLKLLHFSAAEFDEKKIEERYVRECFQLVQVSFSGYNRPYEKHGNKHIVTAPGYLLTYVSLEDTRNETGRRLVITQEDREVTGARVITEIQFYDGLKIARFQNIVENCSDEVQTLEYLSSFAYTGIDKEGDGSSDAKMVLYIPHNGWQKEMSWKKYRFPDLGLGQTQPTVLQRTSKTIEMTNTGNWSTKEYLPMGYLENTEAGTSLFWQIEHNGSWHTEISDQDGYFYLNVSGPTEVQSHWFKELKPGERFVSVPAAVGVSENRFEQAMGELTEYRRRIRRKNKDNERLPVIFNDYMNCLFGDPTTEKELPMIDAAARAGCEYYVIDAGWYASGEWWDSVGEWRESRERFPNGLVEVTDYIRQKGMVPGVWLELEVMGIFCKMASEVEEDWFFVRHGRRVYDRSRYQLDFRNPKVREYVTGVVERVVKDYHVGYIKLDYNMEPGIGTELYAESVGQGLLEHERAYLKWLDEIFEAYPGLVIENCSSGGLRIDYALLSRYSIQSTSDQEDYENYSTIAVNAPAGVTPEQAAVWSYPQRDGDAEEVIFNMVNAMLLRIHQSGHLAELSEERFQLVQEGIACYKSIRHDIPFAHAVWPLGLADSENEWVSMGLMTEKVIYLAVWRRQGDRDTVGIPLACYLDKTVKVTASLLYPKDYLVDFDFDSETRLLTVNMPEKKMARLFRLEYC